LARPAVRKIAPILHPFSKQKPGQLARAGT
jgi:hypothetical protein